MHTALLPPHRALEKGLKTKPGPRRTAALTFACAVGEICCGASLSLACPWRRFLLQAKYVFECRALYIFRPCWQSQVIIIYDIDMNKNYLPFVLVEFSSACELLYYQRPPASLSCSSVAFV